MASFNAGWSATGACAGCFRKTSDVVQATVLRENLCRFDELPLVARVNSLAGFASGTRVLLDVSDIDLLDLTFHCEYMRELRVFGAAGRKLGTGLGPINALLHETFCKMCAWL